MAASLSAGSTAGRIALYANAGQILSGHANSGIAAAGIDLFSTTGIGGSSAGVEQPAAP